MSRQKDLTISMSCFPKVINKHLDLELTRMSIEIKDINRVAMIGLGYIGLPTAALMASRGLEVIGVDVNQKAVDTINAGNVHIVEPDLDIVVRSTVTTGNLRATTVMEKADAFLVAVPTPFKGDHVPDLKYIESAASSMAPVLEKGNLVILESTSPVGTTEKLAAWLSEKRPDLTFPQQAGENADIQVAHCPERVLPGQVLQELVSNDRIIGGMTAICSKKAQILYKKFVKGNCIVTNARTAEMAKLTENAFRDTNIAFANELSLLCKRLEIDVWELIELANRHPRVNILQPGPGVGGHCIAVDPWFIVDSAPDLAKMVRTAREVNDEKPNVVLAEVDAKAQKFKEPTIACFGVAFKPNIDDLRESPALQIAEKLVENKLTNIIIVEPNIDKLPDYLQSNGAVLMSIEQALIECDIVVGLVDHDEFKSINQSMLSEKIVLDYKGMWRF